MTGRPEDSSRVLIFIAGLTAGLVILLLAALLPFTLLTQWQRPAAEAQSLPTLAPLATEPPATTAASGNDASTETPSPSATLPPAVTLGAGQSAIVRSGDTSQTIALAYQIGIEGLLAANPWLRTDTALLPGQILRLPDAALLASLPPTPTPSGPVGTVITEDSKLFLRESPSASGTIILSIPPASRISLSGYSEDGDWLRARYQGFEGWVLAQWVQVDSGIADLVAITAAPESSPEPVPTASRPTLAPPTGSAGNAPYLSNLTDRAIEIYRRGLQLGNQAGIFSKVGDSITDNEQFLVPFGTGAYKLGDYGYLQEVIDYYNATPLRGSNAFAVESMAARRLWSTWYLLNFDMINDEPCYRGESPLICEYRLSRPSVALIMIGTNDVLNTSPIVYERFLREVIETSIDQGVLPVVSTIPEMTVFDVGGKVDQLNAIVRALAIEYGIPLWDYWAASQALPNHGLSEDGVHPGFRDPGNLQAEYLSDGMNVRNLTALQTLDALWRGVIEGRE